MLVRDLAPPLRHDFELALHGSEAITSFAGIAAKTLLMGGDRSPGYLKRAVRRLESIIPEAERVEIAALGHEGSWNADRGGRPEVVAAAMAPFFA